MKPSDFEQLKETWEVLGHDDPLWAVASRDDKRGGRWDLAEFLATGEEDVAQYFKLLRTQAGHAANFKHVLDFGCGVGRLSLAWSQRAERVTGVDISSTMINHGSKILAHINNLTLIVNQRDDLSCFGDGQFDLVFSHICLQHIPWPIAARYLGEFARVCAPEGYVTFQLPARNADRNRGAHWRKKIVEGLPWGLGKVYRRWRHGSGAAFEMHFTPPEVVIPTAQASGLELSLKVPDQSAGPQNESYIYIFRKRRSP